MEYEIISDKSSLLLLKPKAGDKMLIQTSAIGWHTKGIKKINKQESFINKLNKKINQFEVYQAYLDNQEISMTSIINGEIIAINLSERETPIVIQNKSLLASGDNVKIEAYYKRKFGPEIFKKDDFIMSKLEGQGNIFLSFNGGLYKYDLSLENKLVINVGYLVAIDYGCRLSFVKKEDVGLFNKQEESYNIVIQGPGSVYLQTVAINKLKIVQSNEE